MSEETLALESSIQTQVSMLEELVSILNQEKAALRKYNYEALSDITTSKKDKLVQIDECHRTQPEVPLTDISESLNLLYVRRHELTEQCKKINLAIGAHINRQTHITQRSLDLLQGVDSSIAGMYSKEGTNVRSSESRMATVV